LVREKRISSAHHVTLIHVSQSNKNRKVWEKYEKLCEDYAQQQVRVYINKIVSDSQIMALVVNRIEPPTIYSMNKVAHITVGTVNKSVKAAKSNTMCELALFGNHEKVTPNIRVINLERELEVKGTVKPFS
jgi:tRNA ligase